MSKKSRRENRDLNLVKNKRIFRLHKKSIKIDFTFYIQQQVALLFFALSGDKICEKSPGPTNISLT